MARKVRTTFLYVVASVFFCASLYHHYLRDAISAFSSDQLPPSPAVIPFSSSTSASASSVIHEDLTGADVIPPHGSSDPTVTPSPSSPPQPPPSLSTTAILMPDWEVLVIVSPDQTTTTTASNPDGYSCLFHTGEISPARFSGVLPFPDRATFSCVLPTRARRKLPFKQPALSQSPERDSQSRRRHQPPPLLRLSFLAYDSLTTDDDVVLFVKGVNVRQGVNRDPSEFRCVFGEGDSAAVTTAVTASMQEVFRCKLPAALPPSADRPVKISLQIAAENLVVPSVAYYTPPRKLAPSSGKSLMCAATMVYDVAKFLREWVLYHSRIGVSKFILYDNGSDDDLAESVDELSKQGFDISTYFWRWPKTQEAGFSHSAIYAREACSWMMYLDVDEFVYSPHWQNVSTPSESLLHSLVKSNSSKLAQISINCHEFGPSGQKAHPATGVTQGYNCRRMYENRHKSIVKLDAVDDSLLNVIHHFRLRPGYKTRKPNSHEMVVNHYKYQAWSEFKVKFRRRVSAYVLDWTQKLNPHSNDRTPGLGFAPVEPKGWAQKFCEVHDNRLRDLARRWLGVESGSGLKMAWER